MIRRHFLTGASAFAGAALAPIRFAIAATESATASANARPLMAANLAHSLDARCRRKVVCGFRLIDDMEHDLGWSASPAVTLGYTTQRAKGGSRSLRFHTLVRDEAYIRSSRLPNGSFVGRDVAFVGAPFAASASLRFASPQDWSGYNRLSLWCYLHATDNPINNVSVQFLCDGASAGPADPIYIHYIGDLKAGEWNQLLWEISEYPRDRVSELLLFVPASGTALRGTQPEVTYDFDQLQLERVEVEPVSGWAVSPHKIAYSHIGYQPQARKRAVAGEGSADGFELLDAGSAKVVASFPARQLNSRLGSFRVLDFSEFSREGQYRIRCGSLQSEAFPIGEGIWDPLIDSTLNAFYGFRCGCAIPGFHDACHVDVEVTYQGERRSVGGGWHDAANLTQGPGRTHLSIYALMRLYEGLQPVPEQKARAERVLEEARWGLDWSLRMRFGPGLRCLYGTYSYWTDGVRGNEDDVLQDNVGRDLFQNILAVLATATSARVLAKVDPALSAKALACAREDYEEAKSHVSQPPSDSPPIPINQGSWRDHIGYLTLASVELYRITREPAVRADALKFGRWLMALQERRFVDASPITGYFYEDAARTRIVHEFHSGFEDSGLLGLQALCDEFPDEGDWIDWYAGLVVYSEYFCVRGSQASAPFQLIPAAVWRRSDLTAPLPVDGLGKTLAKVSNPVFPTDPSDQQVLAQMSAMFEAGLHLTPDMRLRIFPLWHNHVQHGATTVHLAKTAGLASAAQTRGRLELSDLAAQQLQWVLGNNPFSRSLMYGVGYDYWQNFTVSMPNLVGGLSLGFNSYADDTPAWGNNAVFPYKEQWVFSSCRVALNLAYIGQRARIEGAAAAATTLREERSGRVTELAAGAFDTTLSAGHYHLQSAGVQWSRTFVAGRHYHLSLDARHCIELSVASAAQKNATVRFELTVRGAGQHELRLLLFNCETSGELQRQISLPDGADVRLSWELRIKDQQLPWIAVVVPDNNLDLKAEAFGP
jgi:hypothetical protein